MDLLESISQGNPEKTMRGLSLKSTRARKAVARKTVAMALLMSLLVMASPASASVTVADTDQPAYSLLGRSWS